MKPLLGKLSGTARREIIRNTLPGYIAEGYSANNALKSYREKGLGIGRSDFLGIFREVTGEEIKSGRIRNVNRDNTPTDAIFDDMKYDTPEKYRIIGKGSIFNEKTRQYEEIFFGWDTSNIGTIEEIEQQGLEVFKEKYPGIGDSLVSFRVHKGFINPKYK